MLFPNADGRTSYRLRPTRAVGGSFNRESTSTFAVFKTDLAAFFAAFVTLTLSVTDVSRYNGHFLQFRCRQWGLATTHTAKGIRRRECFFFQSSRCILYAKCTIMEGKPLTFDKSVCNPHSPEFPSRKHNKRSIRRSMSSYCSRRS